jgi:hypothetical protein
MLIFDSAPESTPGEVPSWEPEAEPSTASLLLNAFVDHTADAARRTRKLAGALVDARKPLEHAFKFARAVEMITGGVDPLPFNGPVGSRRCFEVASVPLEVVLETRRAFGATVNDIGLAAVTGALRRYCSESGIDPESLRCIKAICPVDNRAPGDKRPGSDVSSMIVDLPVDEPDLHARVACIAERSRAQKRIDVADGVNMWARVTSIGKGSSTSGRSTSKVTVLRSGPRSLETASRCDMPATSAPSIRTTTSLASSPPASAGVSSMTERISTPSSISRMRTPIPPKPSRLARFSFAASRPA